MLTSKTHAPGSWRFWGSGTSTCMRRWHRLWVRAWKSRRRPEMIGTPVWRCLIDLHAFSSSRGCSSAQLRPRRERMPAMSRVPIVMKVWASSEPHDFEYISRSIPSLLRSGLSEETDLLVVDNGSTDPRLGPFLQDLARSNRRIRVHRIPVNEGPNVGQAEAYSIVEAEYSDAPFFINVDDDVVYHRHWFRRLLQAREECRSFGLDGIFTALNM